MDKLFTLLIVVIVVFSFQSCVDEIVVAEKEGPSGKIVLNSEPAGARIFLLGNDIKKVTPDSITSLETGEYKVTLKKLNYSDTTFTVIVYDSLISAEMISLRSLVVTGSLALSSEPVGADIFLDSVNTLRKTPDTLRNLAAGDYTISLRRENYKDTTLSVVINENIVTAKSIILKSLIKPGNIFITSEPADAEIFLNSTETGKNTPDSIKNLSPGEYQVTLRKESFADTTFSITVFEDTTVSRNIGLTENVFEGNIFITSQPEDADIYLNGIDTKKNTPDSLLHLSPRTYQLTLKKDNYADTTFSIIVYKDSTVSRSIVLTEKIYNGNIFLDSEPDGARIFLNNNDTEKLTPSTLTDVETGNYQVTLIKENYNDTTFSITVYDDSTISKTITLTQENFEGNIFLNSQPDGARIFLNNNDTKELTPATLNNLAVGSYQVTLRKENYFDTTFAVTVYDDSTVSRTIALSLIKGKIFLDSEPVGARIFFNGNDTEKETPDTLSQLDNGVHSITLRKEEFRDTTFNVTVTENSIASRNIVLTSIKGILSLESSPSGAEIYLGNMFTNKTTPDTLVLNEGEYDITLKRNDYYDSTFSVKIIHEQTTHKNIVLTEYIERGDLHISSQPSGAEIFIENDDTDEITPETFEGLEVGEYDVRLELPDYRDTMFTVTVKKDKRVEKNIQLTEKQKVQISYLDYSITLFGQVRFTFSFNQDVTLSNVKVLEPESSEPETFDFHDELIKKDERRNIYYPQFKRGKWKLTFTGKKASISKLEFEKTVELEIL